MSTKIATRRFIAGTSMIAFMAVGQPSQAVADGLEARLAKMQRPAQVGARPVHTYSVVARDADTGELGVAVQSHWFSVGSVVPWAEAGVGAVATQSFVDPSYGKLGLDLMRVGRSVV